MRLPNLSPAVARRPSTIAGLLDSRVAAQGRVELGCDELCNPNDNQCAAPCPNCWQVRGSNNYACQK